MNIRFWGVRGSVTTPLQAEQIQSKIAAVVSQIAPHDIESEDARQRFIANLPKHLYGTVGGNSSCVEVILSGGEKIILDAGSGIRLCGKQCNNIPNSEYHLLFSHFHWDHIQGLPFFDPAYKPDTILHIYSASPDAKKYLSDQMASPYFPVGMASFTKNIVYHTIEEKKFFTIGNTQIMCKKMFHPGSSYSFLFIEKGKRFIHATDVELQQCDFEQTEENIAFFDNADVLVLDSQYTVEDATEKVNWGHSVFCNAIDFAHIWHIKELYLFHHEPTYDDKKLFSILKAAQWYSDDVCNGEVIVHLSIEGREINL